MHLVNISRWEDTFHHSKISELIFIKIPKGNLLDIIRSKKFGIVRVGVHLVMRVI